MIEIYMDDENSCNNIIDIGKLNIHSGNIYSHRDFNKNYLYLPEIDCMITIKTKSRIWLRVEHFNTNSTSFPRCLEYKYASVEDRLQIFDGHRNGSLLRIVCGRDTDKNFDLSLLLLKSSMFTLHWQTKSQAFGFKIKFVSYELAYEDKCRRNESFLCENKRCIDESIVCADEDQCGDESNLRLDRRVLYGCHPQILWSVHSMELEDYNNHDDNMVQMHPYQAARLLPLKYPLVVTQTEMLNENIDSNNDDDDQNVMKKQRRGSPRSKANLAGLWGVPSVQRWD
ncbi:unnamed protein product [Didymodactylos carnosus]|uniref:CUB domain-containing protein n=1 Tax=Didymodactylos carnosus TaxID=1234261 RepID=A0A813PXQ8_9BILA|nr:unnamed protein product [Didymodactylos carnosus]CAF3538523.1 unnamed protein product [Didymodactylos carnosus]